MIAIADKAFDGNPAVIIKIILDPWLCAPVFRRVCCSHCAICGPMNSTIFDYANMIACLNF
jgi:hypothetical protein